ncbi:hypothetical protein [Thiohalophilus thiocyanatoxydans]|uniref:Mannitol repressor n=1 Tax=Thiohalophilus thiocyanatoxydans TaxID=381308 RepID=A0A4R8IT30_9GAMM|nr:hypothetical protein [Thiohalophilus thiocyanatoxydans]TDY04202.1 hypothetical protein EDC23_0574 [Thiohalophilus thiocyanatoxydans]
MSDMNEHFLSHPDLRPYFDEIFPLLLAESDRGAVLLGVSKIDEYLKNFFENLVPESVSGKRRKEIFNYSGAFGTLSSKLDIALVCRLLSSEIVDAIHKMRKIRNDLAHQTLAFNLKDYQVQFYEVFSLIGPGVDVGINRMAVEAMMENMLTKLTNTENPIEEGKPLFEGKGEALEYLSQNGEVLKVLEEKRPRWELAIGVAIICGLILLYRDKISDSLDGNKTILSLLGSQ